MEYVFYSISAIIGGLAVMLLILSVTFAILPPEKTRHYKETVTALVQRVPTVNIQTEVTNETKTK